jgi:hypothetical protein
MKGDILLLAHLAAFDEPEPEEERPSGTERLEAAVGPALAHALLAAFAPARARADA